MSKIVIRDMIGMQTHKGGFGPGSVEIEFGDLAVDALRHATAEQLFAAFRGVLPDADAKTVIGILLDADLTFDSVIEIDLDEPEARHAR